MMRGAYFSLKYMTAAEVQRVGKELRNSLQHKNPQPGWYIKAHCNDGYDQRIKLTRITPYDALKIAERFGQPAVNLFDEQQRSHDKFRTDRREAAQRQLEAAQAALAVLDDEEKERNLNGAT